MTLFWKQKQTCSFVESEKKIYIVAMTVCQYFNLNYLSEDTTVVYNLPCFLKWMIYMADACIDHRTKMSSAIFSYCTWHREKGFQVTLDRKCYFCEIVSNIAIILSWRLHFKNRMQIPPQDPQYSMRYSPANVSIAWELNWTSKKS